MQISNGINFKGRPAIRRGGLNAWAPDIFVTGT
jgi:hypothetical protein